MKHRDEYYDELNDEQFLNSHGWHIEEPLDDDDLVKEYEKAKRKIREYEKAQKSAYANKSPRKPKKG